ncbi:MAG: GntR family transcriptional regulator [Treponema sp.]
MKYNNTVPIYMQIIEKIKHDILIGTLRPGTRLPSIQDMAVIMEVNQNTICRVYKECEMSGLIETKRGIGSFVIDDPAMIEKLRNEKITQIADSYMKGLRGLGFADEQMVAVLERKLIEKGEV